MHRTVCQDGGSRTGVQAEHGRGTPAPAAPATARGPWPGAARSAALHGSRSRPRPGRTAGRRLRPSACMHISTLLPSGLIAPKPMQRQNMCMHACTWDIQWQGRRMKEGGAQAVLSSSVCSRPKASTAAVNSCWSSAPSASASKSWKMRGAKRLPCSSGSSWKSASATLPLLLARRWNLHNHCAHNVPCMLHFL